MSGGGSAAEFRRQLKQAHRMMELRVLAFYRRLVLECYARIVKRTPVDVGRAKANWHLTGGAPAEGLVAEPTIAPVTKSGRARSKKQITSMLRTHFRREAARQNQSAVRLATRITLAEVAWIVNNLEYVGALEDGHSTVQAPLGMVAITVQEVKLIAEQLAAELRLDTNAVRLSGVGLELDGLEAPLIAEPSGPASGAA